MGNILRSFDSKRIPRGYYIISGVGTTFGVAVLIKDAYGGKQYDVKLENSVLGKTAIVTGANCGIGKQTARGLAARGAKVVMACRDLDKCEAVRKEILQEAVLPSIECKKLDLSSCESIREFAASIQNEHRAVDILVNNAAVMCCKKQHTTDGFEWQLGVNYFGHFLLTMLLLDKLKAAENGRIINLVSPVFKTSTIYFEDLNSQESYNEKEAYGQSKLALVLFTQELARRLEGTNVTINSVNPGVVKTDIGRHLPMGKAKISGSIASPILWLFMKSAYQGAQTPIFLAVDPSVEKVTGKYFDDLKEGTVPERCSDESVADRLWRVSMLWTGLEKAAS